MKEVHKIPLLFKKGVTLQVPFPRRLRRRTREKGKKRGHPAPRQGTVVPCTPAQELKMRGHPTPRQGTVVPCTPAQELKMRGHPAPRQGTVVPCTPAQELLIKEER